MPIKKNPLKFIDLFARIGGFPLAMQANGGKCVFSSEWGNQKGFLTDTWLDGQDTFKKLLDVFGVEYKFV